MIPTRAISLFAVCFAVLPIGEAGASTSVFDIDVAFHAATPTTYSPSVAYSFASDLLQNLYDGTACVNYSCCVSLSVAGAPGIFGSPTDGLDELVDDEFGIVLRDYSSPQTKIVTSFTLLGVVVYGVTKALGV